MRLSKDPHNDRDERQSVDETQVKGEGGPSLWRAPVQWLPHALAARLAAFMGVMALLYVGTNIFTAIHNVYTFRGITMSQLVMTELGVVLICLGQILFPHLFLCVKCGTMPAGISDH
mgnify:CR=1 FL=1